MKREYSKFLRSAAGRLAPAMLALCFSLSPAWSQGVCATSGGGACNTALADFAISDGTPDMFFFDTDSGQSDWKFLINDGSAAGPSHFDLVQRPVSTDVTIFRIDGGARANSIRVDSGGNVGFGTSTPAQELHVIDTDGFPALRLEDTVGTAQTWDLEGDSVSFAVFDQTAVSRPFQIVPGAPSAVIYIAANGRIGSGTASPQASLDISKQGAQVLVQDTNGAPALRTLFRMVNNGPVNTQHETGGATWRQQFQNNAYTLTKNGTGGNEVTIIASTGNMIVRGTLTTGGPTCGGGCDELFSPAGQVESIEEHADSMWENSHLPAVGPTAPGAPINLSEKMGGLINELEKAHIYIEQLHEELRQKDERIDAVEMRLARLESALPNHGDDD